MKTIRASSSWKPISNSALIYSSSENCDDDSSSMDHVIDRKVWGEYEVSNENQARMACSTMMYSVLGHAQVYRLGA